jgi:hypothetical protein
MILAAHQCSFLPWVPFFRKIHLADKFCLMTNCQFEKNSFLNRCNVKGEWWTVPVVSGNTLIADKLYMNGSNLAETNINLIKGFMGVFGMPLDKLVYDRPTIATGTDRIIQLCHENGCDEYLTNPEAEEKYLDVALMNKAGIKVIPFTVTNDYKVSLFEAFEKWGIEGTTKMIRKPWKQ